MRTRRTLKPIGASAAADVPARAHEAPEPGRRGPKPAPEALPGARPSIEGVGGLGHRPGAGARGARRLPDVRAAPARAAGAHLLQVLVDGDVRHGGPARPPRPAPLRPAPLFSAPLLPSPRLAGRKPRGGGGGATSGAGPGNGDFRRRPRGLGRQFRRRGRPRDVTSGAARARPSGPPVGSAREALGDAAGGMAARPG